MIGCDYIEEGRYANARVVFTGHAHFLEKSQTTLSCAREN
jgi:hypothetical protein